MIVYVWVSVCLPLSLSKYVNVFLLDVSVCVTVSECFVYVCECVSLFMWLSVSMPMANCCHWTQLCVSMYVYQCVDMIIWVCMCYIKFGVMMNVMRMNSKFQLNLHLLWNYSTLMRKLSTIWERIPQSWELFQHSEKLFQHFPYWKVLLPAK